MGVWNGKSSVFYNCDMSRAEADESFYFGTKWVGKNWPLKWVIIVCEYPRDNSAFDIPKSLTTKELNPGFIIGGCLKLALV